MPHRLLPFAALLVLGHPTLAAAAAPVEARPVLSEPLPNVPGSAVTMVRVTLPPGAASAPHHHAGSVAVYVLAGTLRSKVGEGPVKTFHAGDTFFEPAGALHAIAENPSGTDATELLAVFVAPKGATLTQETKR